MSALELSIAWRYLRSRRRSRLLSLGTVIAMGGVIVGVSALILIIGVMTGLQKDLRDKILLASPDVRILNFGADVRIDDWKPVLDKVRTHPDVVAAGPFVMAQAGITRANNAFATAAQLVGLAIPDSGAGEVTRIRSQIQDGKGKFEFGTGDGTGRGIVLGQSLADKLLVIPGNQVIVIPITGAIVHPFVGVPLPISETFDVTGIFKTGMYEYDDNYAYISLGVGQQLVGLGSGVTGIEVRVKDRDQSRRVASELEESLGRDYRAESWEQSNQSLFQALKLEKLGMAIILLLIVIVAAFNIVGMLTMMVSDKTREIGILRAMGMRADSVRRIFFAQGIIIGAVGTGVGLGLGLIGAALLRRLELVKLDPDIYFIDTLPVVVEPLDVLWIVIASMVIAALATLPPAAQAARLYPIDAIRHE